MTRSFLHDGNRVPTVPRSGVEVQVQTRFLANVGEEPYKGTFALPFAADEDDLPGSDASATTHRSSAETRNAAEHSSAILRIEPSVPA